MKAYLRKIEKCFAPVKTEKAFHSALTAAVGLQAAYADELYKVRPDWLKWADPVEVGKQHYTGHAKVMDNYILTSYAIAATGALFGVETVTQGQRLTFFGRRSCLMTMNFARDALIRSVRQKRRRAYANEILPWAKIIATSGCPKRGRLVPSDQIEDLIISRYPLFYVDIIH